MFEKSRKFARSTPFTWLAQTPLDVMEMIDLPGNSVADLDGRHTQNMDVEPAELERMSNELPVIAAVLRRVVDERFEMVQGLDLCRCRS